MNEVLTDYRVVIQWARDAMGSGLHRGQSDPAAIVALADEVARLEGENTRLHVQLRWVPVSEGLPNTGIPVLVSLDSLVSDVGRYQLNGKWCRLDGSAFGARVMGWRRYTEHMVPPYEAKTLEERVAALERRSG